MNCKNCGVRFPDRYLTLESFQCPECGRKYFRKPTPDRKTGSTTRTPHRRKAPVKMRKTAIAVVILLLILGGILAWFMGGSKKDDPVAIIASTAVPANTQVASVASTIVNTASPAPMPTLIPATTKAPATVETVLSSHKESTDESVFLTMYNDWFSAQETRYEFAGMVETGSVTEQELPSAYLHAYNVIYEDGWTLSYFVPVDGEGNELPFVYTQEADYLTIVYPEEYAAAHEEPEDNSYVASETKSYSEFTADEYVVCGKDLLLKYLRYPESVRWQQAGVNSTDGYGRALVVIYCMAKNIYGGTSAECYWVCIEMNQDGTYSYNPEMPYCLGDTMDILAIRNLNNWGSPR